MANRSLRNNPIIDVIGLQTPRGRLIFFAVAAVFIFMISFEDLQGLPDISLYARLGIPSPSIGLTRAFWHVTHGDFAAAYAQNPLIYPVLLVVCGIILNDIRRLVFQKYKSD